MLNTLSMTLLFRAMDALRFCGRTTAVFALAIGSSLFFFTIYSLFIVREPHWPYTILSLVLITSGAVAISL